MIEANEFKAVYRSAERYDELLPPHYFEGVDDADLVGRLMDEHYGRSERRRTLHVLELGCGTGRVTSRLAPYAQRLGAVDNSPSMIEAFQARYPSAETLCLDIKEAVTRTLGRGQAGRFDVIGAFWSLSYCLGECFEEMTADFHVIGNPT